MKKIKYSTTKKMIEFRTYLTMRATIGFLRRILLIKEITFLYNLNSSHKQ
jgi:hypothetical protein